VTEKVGRSGALLFVAIDHQIEGVNGVVIHEEQDLVYRPSSAKSSPTTESMDEDEVPSWDWQIDLPTDSTALFRFSALTYNSHRIHYDRRYAVETEGYPGLVVQGPYQAIGLAELCRRNHREHPLTSFQFRALRPAFDGESLRLRGKDGPALELAAFDASNHRTMNATATYQLD
jgi:3-methylfumaryl-CoA hydratase